MARMISVEPVTVPWIEALADGDAVFTARFGVPVADGWDGFRETLPLLLAAARRGEASPWGPYLVFDEDGALVGNGGWKGEPREGVAELGYAVAPARRNRGIATRLVNELLGQARHANLRLVVAHTPAAESASTAVLRKCGFSKVIDLVDPEDGPVWRWELRLVAK